MLFINYLAYGPLGVATTGFKNDGHWLKYAGRSLSDLGSLMRAREGTEIRSTDFSDMKRVGSQVLLHISFVTLGRLSL